MQIYAKQFLFFIIIFQEWSIVNVIILQLYYSLLELLGKNVVPRPFSRLNSHLTEARLRI